jgi:hypothetical protein
VGVTVSSRHRPVALLGVLLPGLLLATPAHGQATGAPPARKDATGTSATPITASASLPAATPGPGRAPGVEAPGDHKARTLEERVADLKDKVFRTKGRLLNLQEVVIGADSSTGARAVVVHRNEMGASFYLESATYALDGAPIYAKTDVDGDLDRREEFEVFNGRLSPGRHQLSVQLVFRGSGFGLFSYMKEYKFKQSSAHTIDAGSGQAITVRVVATEKGGLTSELKDRLALRYDEEVREEAPAARVAAPGPEGPGR